MVEGVSSVVYSFRRYADRVPGLSVADATALAVDLGGDGQARGAQERLRCTISGTLRNDRLVGTNGRDVICGFSGCDTILARSGNDVVYGGFGADTIYLGDGDDVAFGAADADTISGQAGRDRIDGGGGGDTVEAGTGANWLSLGSGDDVVLASNGSRDVITGGSGFDRARVDSRDRTVGVESFFQPPALGSALLLAAGDIASCRGSGDEETATLLDAFPEAQIAALGDEAYEVGSVREFARCYAPSWGRAKAQYVPRPRKPRIPDVRGCAVLPVLRSQGVTARRVLLLRLRRLARDLAQLELRRHRRLRSHLRGVPLAPG